MDIPLIKILENKKKIKTADFKLVIPSVSVGNVGQLTIDLMITTYGFEKFAIVWDEAIIPSVGSDPFNDNSNNVCTACELFINEDLQLVVMQLRSSIEYKLAIIFFNRLKENIIDMQFKEVIILSSLFSHEMHDVNSGYFRYATNNEESKEECKKLGVLPIETSFGAGFALKLQEVLENTIKSTAIMKYSSEGDNRPDALQMLSILCTLLKVGVLETKYPFSWNYVYGNPPPIGIY